MKIPFFLLVCLYGIFVLSCSPVVPPPPQKAIIGYVPGFRGGLKDLNIDATKLTHINYAFVDVKDSMAWLTNMETDTINFKHLVSLKEKNPNLKILISIGGWSWSENFSDAVLTLSSRNKFAATSVDIIHRYGLDGVDIDWEYPGFKGEDNVFRPEDKENFTLMFQAIREELNRLTAQTGKSYLLTTAIPCFQEFIDRTEMGKLQEYLDYVNLMSYDFYVAGDTAGHHTNLFPSTSYEYNESAHKAFEAYTAAGVPASKLVMGIAFYGRSWFMSSNDNWGIDRPVDSVTRGGGYSFIKDSLSMRPGFVRHWDDKAKAPVLFNEATHQMVSYDDEESVMHKCNYVKEHQMGGVMFWQYASDPKLYLLDAINKNLRP